MFIGDSGVEVIIINVLSSYSWFLSSTVQFGEPLSQLDPQYQQALNQCFLEARIPEPYIL